MRSRYTALGGLAIGAALAVLGIAIAPQTAAVQGTTTTTSTTVAAGEHVWWLDPHETHIGPAVVIPESLTVEGSEAVLTYVVDSLGPPARGLAFSEADPSAIAPETWTLVTPEREYTGTALNVGSRTVRIPIDDQFLIGRVNEIRIDSYRMRIPYEYVLAIEPEPGAAATLDDGRSLTVARVLAQSTSVIVHLDLEIPADPFDETPTSTGFGVSQVDTGDIVVAGVGPEWISNSVRQFAGFQLIRSGPEVPDPLLLRVRSSYWIPVETPVAIDIGGMALG